MSSSAVMKSLLGRKQSVRPLVTASKPTLSSNHAILPEPSARYLKLITDGAEEHSLPSEYLSFLYSIRPYMITTRKQKAGQVLILAIWAPIILSFLGLGKVFADEEGKIPAWLGKLMGLVFGGVWSSYDAVFKGVFGDGERTIGEDDEGGDEDEERGLRRRGEKMPLLSSEICIHALKETGISETNARSA
ncbi:hypothetical protein G7Y89_g15861 [Cudoniella acicularis]|uniref:Uncharacterized protein n=1 Tax=Cudoniella acicularis TaxID=354080 RepID=A0A8H4VHM2_9HELO|nr:hypothetical protein G7Y89_g15861 [Cudoniella acicularis]